MGKIVIKKAVEIEKGYLYYIDGEGNICQTKMRRGRTKKKGKEIRERNRLKKEEMLF